MVRTALCAVAVLAILAAGLARADEQANKSAKENSKHARKATITKVDTKHHTITVRMKNKEGKEVEKTFKLTEDIEYLDSTGRVAAVDVFQSGDEVLVLEEEGHLKQVKKSNKGHTGSAKSAATENQPNKK